MQKMSSQVQLYIQDHIANFDLRGFIAKMPKSIAEMRRREEEEEKKEEEESKRKEEGRRKEEEGRRREDEGKNEEGRKERKKEEEGKKDERMEEVSREEEREKEEKKEEGRDEGAREEGRRKEEKEEEKRAEARKEEGRRRRKDDVFPVVVVSCRLIRSLCGRMERVILQEVIYEICNMNVGMIYKVAASFEEKFDSFLFLMKNLLFLDRCLQDTGIDILVKDHQIDFSETKKTIFELITGHIEGGRREEGGGERKEDVWKREEGVRDEGWRREGEGREERWKREGKGKEEGRIEGGGKVEGWRREEGRREEGRREDDNAKMKSQGGREEEERREEGGGWIKEEEAWGYAKVLSFLYRGMPKVNETTIDVRKNLAEEIKGVTNRYIREMSFIIAKNICDFLRRYHSLKNLKKHASKQETLTSLSHSSEAKKEEEIKREEEEDGRRKEEEEGIRREEEEGRRREEEKKKKDEEELRRKKEEEGRKSEKEKEEEGRERHIRKEDEKMREEENEEESRINDVEETKAEIIEAEPFLPSLSSLLPPPLEPLPQPLLPPPSSLLPSSSSLPPPNSSFLPPKPSPRKDKLDFGSLLSKPILRKQYSTLIDNLYLTSSEMALKGQFFLNESEYSKVSGYLESVVENVVLVLQQFYIVVSEHLEEEEYGEVGMEDIGKVRREVKEMIRGGGKRKQSKREEA